jgi:hypothetical protein
MEEVDVVQRFITRTRVNWEKRLTPRMYGIWADIEGFDRLDYEDLVDALAVPVVFSMGDSIPMVRLSMEITCLLQKKENRGDWDVEGASFVHGIMTSQNARDIQIVLQKNKPSNAFIEGLRRVLKTVRNKYNNLQACFEQLRDEPGFRLDLCHKYAMKVAATTLVCL